MSARPTEEDGGARVAPRRFSRGRIVFFRVVERVARLLGGRAFYRRHYLAPGRLVARYEEVRVADLAPALDGYRLGVVSDVHAGPFLGAGDLASVRETLAAARPDVLLLLGDYVVHGPQELDAVVDDLVALSRVAPDGTFAVFGNHDYKHREEERMVAPLVAAGVVFLRNDCRRIERGGGALAFVGIEDAEEARILDVAAARAGVRAGDVEIALSHNPGAAPAFAVPPVGSAQERPARLVLAGHTHGTQLDLPFLRSLGPPHPGLRVELGRTTLLVSRGVGVVGVPLRVGAPAEVLLVTLRAER